MISNTEEVSFNKEPVRKEKKSNVKVNKPNTNKNETIKPIPFNNTNFPTGNIGTNTPESLRLILSKDNDISPTAGLHRNAADPMSLITDNSLKNKLEKVMSTGNITSVNVVTK
jgi:hypothetical protein